MDKKRGREQMLPVRTAKKSQAFWPGLYQSLLLSLDEFENIKLTVRGEMPPLHLYDERCDFYNGSLPFS